MEFTNLLDAKNRHELGEWLHHPYLVTFINDICHIRKPKKASTALLQYSSRQHLSRYVKIENRRI